MLIYHILNGDALLERFPEEIEGERIVMRECLIDGDVSGNTLEEFFENRANFIAERYEEDKQRYYDHVLPEFEKIMNIPEGAEVNLWFEQDLFCQINMWFVIHLLKENNKSYQLNWVFPYGSQYSYADIGQEDLINLNMMKIVIKEKSFKVMARIWNYFKTKNDQLIKDHLCKLEKQNIYFVDLSIHSLQILREGKHIQFIKGMMKEKDDFGFVFQQFSKFLDMLGMGDSQVKYLYDEIKAGNL